MKEVMQPWTKPFSPEEGADYLANLRCLAEELETAMNCIARQELTPLQDSIKVQQVACTRIAHIQRGRSFKLVGDVRLTGMCVDSDLAYQIEEAISAVLLLNKRYAALLKHSGETLRLFAGLFRSYQGSTQPASGIQVNRQSWSCEM